MSPSTATRGGGMTTPPAAASPAGGSAGDSSAARAAAIGGGCHFQHKLGSLSIGDRTRGCEVAGQDDVRPHEAAWRRGLKMGQCCAACRAGMHRHGTSRVPQPCIILHRR